MGSDGFEKVLIGTRGARETFLRGRKGRAARYVGNPKPTAPGHEHGRKRDGLEKKPRTPLPVGLRFM